MMHGMNKYGMRMTMCSELITLPKIEKREENLNQNEQRQMKELKISTIRLFVFYLGIDRQIKKVWFPLSYIYVSMLSVVAATCFGFSSRISIFIFIASKSTQ